MLITAEFCQCLATHLREQTGATIYVLDIQTVIAGALADTAGQRGAVVLHRERKSRIEAEVVHDGD